MNAFQWAGIVAGEGPAVLGRVGREWSLSALEAQTGYSRPTLNKRLAGVPFRFDAKLNAKLYLLPDVIRAMADGQSGKPDYDAAKARKMSADAGIAEIGFAKARGEVIELALVEQVLTEEYTAVRAKLLNIPAKLAPILDTMPAGIEPKRALLMQEIVEALEELDRDEGIKSLLDLAASLRASQEADSEDTDGEESGVPPAASDDGEPVGRPKAKAKRRK